ncbi:Hypothetical_protein [Hexamita inflata]|uniref:Hypothetical_protein n=1 Tax=Hexamita inflata TaxID=28002 RepID=A0AA86R8Y8_9EUKA|nr:Hypothetical protein HINF_LOCUS56167 [Hexamita inflata]
MFTLVDDDVNMLNYYALVDEATKFIQVLFQSDFMFWYFGVMKLFSRELDELKISYTGTIMCIEFGTFSLACIEILPKSKIQILLGWRCQQLQQLLQLRSQPNSRIYGYIQISIQNLLKI